VGRGDADRFRKYAVELVTLAPDVILATGSPVTSAPLQATRTVPQTARRMRLNMSSLMIV
jgi:hypothetical protein